MVAAAGRGQQREFHIKPLVDRRHCAFPSGRRRLLLELGDPRQELIDHHLLVLDDRFELRDLCAPVLLLNAGATAVVAPRARAYQILVRKEQIGRCELGMMWWTVEA
jgi:hypothetical protein